MNADKLNSLFGTADAILLNSAHNLRYFTGFCGGEGYALITPTERFLFVDSRYTTAAEDEAAGFDVIQYTPGKLYEEISEKLRPGDTVTYEDRYMSAAEYHSVKRSAKNIDFKAASDKIDLLRMIKTPQELEWMAKAEQIGVDAYKAVLPLIKPGISENEIAAELEYQMRKRGADGTSFETIVVSGIKTSMPHGKPDFKKIEYGDFVTMDFGCKYKGYCSDMTRTVIIGKASTEQKKIYSTVLDAQLAGLEAIKSGASCCDADNAARKIISDAGFGKYFGHSLGHGVGLLIHELPNLSPRSNIVLQPNMVVTCEPGIYIPEFGGVRIEDMVYVTDDGNCNLTNLTKELTEL